MTSRMHARARRALVPARRAAVHAWRAAVLAFGVSLIAAVSWAEDAPRQTHDDRPQNPQEPRAPQEPQAPRAGSPRVAAAPASPAQQQAARQAFAHVFRVLQSPRCMNCHPSGNAPLQTDRNLPHAMNISRLSIASGLPCSACHQERNADAMGVSGGPPGAPHWGLPPADTPMIFQGRTPAALCEQLKDPTRNGGRSLADLRHHVSHDPLVLWAWSPGGTRTRPPLAHEQFVAAFSTWVDGGGACPP